RLCTEIHRGVRKVGQIDAQNLSVRRNRKRRTSQAHFSCGLLVDVDPELLWRHFLAIFNQDAALEQKRWRKLLIGTLRRLVIVELISAKEAHDEMHMWRVARRVDGRVDSMRGSGVRDIGDEKRELLLVGQPVAQSFNVRGARPGTARQRPQDIAILFVYAETK